MKSHLPIFFCSLILSACKLEPATQPTDYRIAVIGEYDGISGYTTWSSDTAGIWSMHTYTYPNAKVFLTKGESDSMIEFHTDSIDSPFPYYFVYYYKDTTFRYNGYSHVPYLTLNRDTLSFSLQPGLTPFWEFYKVVRVR